jgi:hypothetical protein
VVPHPTSWVACTYHALGTHAALLASSSSFVFDNIYSLAGSGGVSFINQSLKKLETNITVPSFSKGLKSHSFRAGATQKMHLFNSDLKQDWMDFRCGRGKSLKDTKSAYITRDFECDKPWERIKNQRI